MHRAAPAFLAAWLTAACTDVRAPAIVAGASVARDAATEASAPSPFRTEVELIGRMPADVLDRLRGSTPDANGFMGPNQMGFTCSAYQRTAGQTVTVGVVRERSDWIDQGLRGLEAPFPLQRPEGNFGDSAYCVGYFLADLHHALLVLNESPMAGAFAARVKKLREGALAASRWLAAPIQADDLLREYGRSGHHMAFFGAALELGGRVHDDAALTVAAQPFVRAVLDRQRADGVFLEGDGHDSTFQATSEWKLAWVYVRRSDASLGDSLLRAGIWEIPRIRDNGTLDVTGNIKTGDACTSGDNCLAVNVHEVLWGLLYHGVLFDGAATKAAERFSAANPP